MTFAKVCALAAVCLLALTSCGDDPTVPAGRATQTERHERRVSKADRYRQKKFQPSTPLEAARIARRYVDVPVVLPSPLPAGARPKALYVEKVLGVWSAHLSLEVPDEGTMSIEWGKAQFDGCGGDTAKEIRVAGEPGLLIMTRVGGTVDGQLVWPADKTTLEGTYGLSGRFTRAELIALAESMMPPRVAEAPGEIRGC